MVASAESQSIVLRNTKTFVFTSIFVKMFKSGVVGCLSKLKFFLIIDILPFKGINSMTINMI